MIASRIGLPWWYSNPALVVHMLHQPSGQRRLLKRMSGRDVEREARIRALLVRLQARPHDVLAYRTALEGTFGLSSVAILFPPICPMPWVVPLDGPVGSAASPHRFFGLALCMYHWADPVGQRWDPETDTVFDLLSLARLHLECELAYRSTGRWPIEEAPHAA